MRFLKLKIYLSGFLAFGLLIGGFSGICSLFNKDMHAVSHAQESSTMPMMSEASSSCCEIHAPNNSFFEQLGSSIVENKNFGSGMIFLAGLIFAFLLEFFNQTEKFIASRIYYLRQSISILHNYLLLAFSQGILNTKIYNVAV